MRLTRRDILKAGALTAGAAALPRAAEANPIYAPSPGAWRTFEVVTRVEVAKPGRSMQAWLPIPAHADAAWVKAAKAGLAPIAVGLIAASGLVMARAADTSPLLAVMTAAAAAFVVLTRHNPLIALAAAALAAIGAARMGFIL